MAAVGGGSVGIFCCCETIKLAYMGKEADLCGGTLDQEEQENRAAWIG